MRQRKDNLASQAPAGRSFVIPDGEGARLRVHVVPRASKTEVVGLQGDALKIRLQAPPVDGKANQALCEFVADAVGLPKRQVRVVAGETSREKTLLVSGATPARVADAFPLP